MLARVHVISLVLSIGNSATASETSEGTRVFFNSRNEIDAGFQFQDYKAHCLPMLFYVSPLIIENGGAMAQMIMDLMDHHPGKRGHRRVFHLNEVTARL